MGDISLSVVRGQCGINTVDVRTIGPKSWMLLADLTAKRADCVEAQGDGTLHINVYPVEGTLHLGSAADGQSTIIVSGLPQDFFSYAYVSRYTLIVIITPTLAQLHEQIPVASWFAAKS